MTFIEEITPYIERIKLHYNGGRITNLEVLKVIRDIHFRYIRKNDFNTPANLGCNNCVRQMINQLIGKIERDGQNTDNIVAKHNIDSLPKGDVGKFLGNDLESELFPTESKKMTFPSMKVTKEYKETIPKRWGQFKKYCTTKGLTVKGKTRKELENELKGL